MRLRLLSGFLVVLLAAPLPVAAELFRYIDASGSVHFVDDPELVPARYRDQLAKGETRRIQIQPALAAPPTPRRARPAPAPTRGSHRPFSVAPLEFQDGQPEPGAWVDSTEIAPGPTVRIVVAATWCPHCVSFFQQIASDPGLRNAIDLIAFFDDEGEEQDRLLTYPERIAGIGLDFHLVQRADLGGVVTSYPSVLECNAKGCRKKSRRKFIEKFATP